MADARAVAKADFAGGFRKRSRISPQCLDLKLHDMKTIVVGAGFTGIQLSRSLVASGAEVVLVENDSARAAVAREQVDCAVVEADGNNPATLESAGLADADALVALTDDDEVNLITCALADAVRPSVKKLARVRNYAYYERTARPELASAARRAGHSRPVFGVDRMLNPDVEAAAAICRAMEYGLVGNVIDLDGGHGIAELAVAPGGRLDGVALRNAAERTGRRMLVAFVSRAGEAMLPDGSTTLQAGDRIGVVVDAGNRDEMFALAGAAPEGLPRRAAVFGAGLVGRFVAKRLLADGGQGEGLRALFGSTRRRRREIVVVDADPARCREAANALPGARVLCGDVTEEAFLHDEGLDACDIAVTATSDTERNLVAAAYLKGLGVARTVALTASASFDEIARKLGIDVAVPLRDSVVDAIAGHLRGRSVHSVHSVCNRSFEIVECDVEPGSPAADRPLSELSLPGDFLALLTRAPGGGPFAVPDGSTILAPGARVVLVMRPGSPRAMRVFSKP